MSLLQVGGLFVEFHESPDVGFLRDHVPHRVCFERWKLNLYMPYFGDHF